ncbi:MAG: Type secretion system protein, partial [Patescibacteria group bacterium]|nr:Type secretion system protein [Patescibacteria group bacterium]
METFIRIHLRMTPSLPLFFFSSMLVQAMKATKGFTLVELIVVITILAILATIGFLSLQGYTSDAKNTKTVANLRTVASTLVNESGITGQGFDAYGKALSDPSNSMSGVAGTGDTVYSGAVDWTSSAYYAADVDA